MNEPGYGIPDCSGIPETAARHAKQLSSVGIDFVTVDATNLGQFSTFADVIQLRPGEVLFEEWCLGSKTLKHPKLHFGKHLQPDLICGNTY
jgi:hypothetical protein